MCVKPSTSTAGSKASEVTITSHEPGDPAGTTTVSPSGLMARTSASTSSKKTRASDGRWSPFTTATRPPSTGPLGGTTSARTGLPARYS